MTADPTAETSARRFQGVGFRYFVQRRATGLGLAGWVRNRADGTVEAFAEGPAPALQALAEELARGPAMSRVERVEESPAAPSGEQAFRITH